MTERKFKVGDKVSAKKHYGEDFEAWQNVTIIDVRQKGDWPYTVMGSSVYPDEEGDFSEDELEFA